MGAFFLYSRKKKIDLKGIQEIYERKGFDSPKLFDIGDYQLMLFKKYLLNIDNYFLEERYSVFAIGSFIYKGLSYKQSMELLLSDYKKNTIDKEKIQGNYAIIFFDKSTKKIEFYIDPASIKNVYFDKENAYLSTDFLALLHAGKGSLSLNKLAIIESITTGNLISPDTYVNEIEKIDKRNLEGLGDHFSGISFKTFRPEVNGTLHNREEAITHANDLLVNYFKASASISNEFGAHIGLTGGFDSRLLLMHARKQIEKLNTNSFWRPNSREYINAKELAEVSRLDFFSFEKQTFKTPEKDDMFNELMYVHDGQVRSQNRWDEEFALKAYTAGISNNHWLGFHGCGGEQYRNADRLAGKILLRSFILNEWMFKQGSNTFIDPNLKWEVHQNIERKLRRLLTNLGSKIGLFELKQIQNEVWNTANRTTRVNVLNQQQFYFAPFTEYLISQNAYQYIPFLGRSLSFQMEMMKKFDTQLAAVNTNYGFNLIEGEPIKNHITAHLINIFPREWVLYFYNKIKSKEGLQNNTDHFIRQAHPLLQEFQQSIDYSVLINNVNLSPGLYAFDYLLKTVLA